MSRTMCAEYIELERTVCATGMALCYIEHVSQ